MPMTVAAIVVAAGRGLRAGGDLPKQYRQIAGEPVIRPSLARPRAAIRECRRCSRSSIPTTRARSPRRRPGLRAAAAGARRRDPAGIGPRRARGAGSRARPRSSSSTTRRGPSPRAALIDARHRGGAAPRGAAVPALPVTDTMKRVERPGMRDRHGRPRAACAVQTPQAFRIRRAARRASRARTPRAARISPTMPRSRNGPACTVATLRRRGRQRQAHHGRGFRRAPTAAQLAALGDVRTGIGYRRASLRPTATTSCSAACAFPHDARRSPAIPMPTWCCMR